MEKDILKTDIQLKAKQEPSLLEMFASDTLYYDKNPVVAALVNGELRSLNSTAYKNATIVPVRLFSNRKR